MNGDYKGDGGLQQADILKLFDRVNNSEADTVIYSQYPLFKTQEEIHGATAMLLEKLGRTVSIFQEGVGSGPDLYDFGFWEKLQPQVESNWKMMEPLKDRKFVFTDPHSQEFIVKRYPEIVSGYKTINNQHISQLLADSLKEGKLKSKDTGKVKVSYHDPCYLGRGLGIYDAPREVLNSLKGVELVEMGRNRQDSFCCGARVMGNYVNNLSEDTARERLKEFEATGADLLITACANCKSMFQKVLPENERGRVKDITEFTSERT